MGGVALALRIELEELWRRLSVRFKARRAGDEDEGYPVILPTVQPVTDFDELAKIYQSENVGTMERTAVAGTGRVQAYQIPEGKRYHIYAISLTRTSGDGTLDHLYVEDGFPTRIWNQAAASTIQTNLLPIPVILDEGQLLSVNVAVITGDSVWNVVLYYAEEDAF